MEAGPTQLEEFAAEARERFARVETRLDQMVTRAEFAEAIGAVRGEIGALRVELYKGFTGMVKWIVGTAVVFGAAAVTVITFVLNYAAPPRILPAPLVQTIPAPPPPPPVIIQIPAYPAPPARQ
ncbi:hypothetical protein [Massilia sp. TWR1-2-2]|uniref:hypothetical protein n=1 Tax=Massilia sp. TWR1-2-2 TaxID=2804584 RepID=UPI003CE789C8